MHVHDHDNENVNKTIRAFLYISLLSLHDDHVKLPNFTLYGGGEHKTTGFLFLSYYLEMFLKVIP